MTEKTQGIYWLNPVDKQMDLPKGPFTEPTGCFINNVLARWDFEQETWVHTDPADLRRYLDDYAMGLAITPDHLTGMGFNEADHYFGAGEFVHPKMPMFGLTSSFGPDGANGYDLYLLRPRQCFILGNKGVFKTMGQVKDFYSLMGVEL